MNTNLNELAVSPADDLVMQQAGSAMAARRLTASVSALEDQTENDLGIDQDLPRLLYELAVRLPAQPDVQALCIWLYEPTGQAVRLHVLMADLPIALKAGISCPVADSIAGWVWKSQEMLTINTEEERRFPEFASALLDAGIKSFCGVPLMIPSRRIGVLGLASTKPDAFRHFKFQFMHR